MPMIDWGLFIKIMSRTQSNQDGEVLIAIHKANDMLKKAGLQWHQVVNGTMSNGNAYNAEEIFRQATQRAREAREYASDFSTDALRAKHAARDAEFSAKHESGDTNYGWTTKGPFDDVHVYTKAPEPEPPDDAVEDAARQQTESINGERAQTNWFVFAMTEPAVAEWLFRLREGHAFHRILFAQVLRRGELSEDQIEVCQRMMKRGQRSTPR
jgi:hypothetical protein